MGPVPTSPHGCCGVDGLQGAPLHAELQWGLQRGLPHACACSRALPSSSGWSGGLAERGDSSAWSLGASVAWGQPGGGAAAAAAVGCLCLFGQEPSVPLVVSPVSR